MLDASMVMPPTFSLPVDAAFVTQLEAPVCEKLATKIAAFPAASAGIGVETVVPVPDIIVKGDA